MANLPWKKIGLQWVWLFSTVIQPVFHPFQTQAETEDREFSMSIFHVNLPWIFSLSCFPLL